MQLALPCHAGREMERSEKKKETESREKGNIELVVDGMQAECIGAVALHLNDVSKYTCIELAGD